jgi:hypothetical protein
VRISEFFWTNLVVFSVFVAMLLGCFFQKEMPIRCVECYNSIFGLCVNPGKIPCCAVTWILKELSVSCFYIFQNHKTTSSGSLRKSKLENRPYKFFQKLWTTCFHERNSKEIVTYFVLVLQYILIGLAFFMASGVRASFVLLIGCDWPSNRI